MPLASISITCSIFSIFNDPVPFPRGLSATAVDQVPLLKLRGRGRGMLRSTGRPGLCVMHPQIRPFTHTSQYTPILTAGSARGPLLRLGPVRPASSRISQPASRPSPFSLFFDRPLPACAPAAVGAAGCTRRAVGAEAGRLLVLVVLGCGARVRVWGSSRSSTGYV